MTIKTFNAGDEVKVLGAVLTITAITCGDILENGKADQRRRLHFGEQQWIYEDDPKVEAVEVPIMVGDRVRYNGGTYEVTLARSIDQPGGPIVYVALDPEFRVLVSAAAVERLPSKEQRIEQVKAAILRTKYLYNAISWDKRGKCPCCEQLMPAKNLEGYTDWAEASRREEELAVWLVADGFATVEEVMTYDGATLDYMRIKRGVEHAQKKQATA